MRIRTITVVIATAMLVAGAPTTPAATALTPGEIRSRITAVRASLRELGRDLNEAERDLTMTHRAIADHQKALREAKGRRATLSASLSARAADLYMYGGATGLDAGIATADISTYVDRITYLEQLQGGEAGLLEEIRALQRHARDRTKALQEDRRDAAELAARMSKRHRELSAKLRELSSLDRFLASVGRGAGRASRGGGRGIVCPVAGNGVVANNFGDPRPGGPHQGNDIIADSGQGVLAVLPGTITETPFGSWWGIGIVLRDLAGNEWWYAHLSSEMVSVGERVSQGELIGRVGCTGTCYGPHLHFEYHPGGGNAVDPYRILSSAC